LPLTGGPFALAQPGPSADDLARLDAYLERERADADLPGLAVVVVRGGQIVHASGFGVADPDGRPMTPQTPAELGSVSKPLTATAALQLVDDGTIRLDTPIQNALPGFTLADDRAAAQITLRHLLTHTSGIATREGRRPFGRTDQDADALQRRVEELKDVSLAHPPGSAFAYSNTNYMLVGALIEALSGRSYEAYMQEEVFGPLEMRSSSASLREVPDLAIGYRYLFGSPSPSADLPRTRISTPSGFLAASAEDVGRYLTAMLPSTGAGDARALSPAWVDTLTSRQQAVTDSVFYGLGWFVREVDGKTVVYHGGTTERSFSEIMMVPEEEWGAILLVNAMGYASGPNFPALARNVRDVLLGRDVQPMGRSPLRHILMLLGGVLVLQAAGAIHSAFVLRRWKRSPDRYPTRAWKRWGWHLALPLVGCLVLAAVQLIGLPYAFDLHLTGLRMYAPDAALLVIVSGAWALLWGAGRTWLFYRVGTPIRHS
jgi:CubicO group peptidase (beta-lactamase class C family)